jgi:MoxR-like ATPase
MSSRSSSPSMLLLRPRPFSGRVGRIEGATGRLERAQPAPVSTDGAREQEQPLDHESAGRATTVTGTLLAYLIGSLPEMPTQASVGRSSVETMTSRFRETYQGADGLEQAVIDLVRVGSRGHPSGVRQLATRLTRAVPDGVRDDQAFREALRDALAEAVATPGLRFVGGEVPVDDGGQHPLVRVDPFPDGSGLVLPPAEAQGISDIVEERARAAELARAGVGLTRTLLLSGPPGVGKTMTAQWLAQRMGLPLVVLELSSVVSSFLGTSGRNIRSVLDYAKSGSCVLLLDEFDALAKRRDDDTDIGELKRIVNVILVELDRWPDSSLLVAATNHAQLLDDAVDRRFDVHIEIPLPGLQERKEILSILAEGTGLDGSVLETIAALTDGSSGSDLARFWRNARRRAVLRGSLVTDELLDDVAWRRSDSGPDRDILWRMLADSLNMSNRQIAQRFGVSHPTVSSGIKRARART